jgi:hypothetical protein
VSNDPHKREPVGFPRAAPDLSPAIERVVEQRYATALAEVTRLRETYPQESADELANRLIRRFAKDMAIGGAVAGGAAAAPVAGMAVAAASAGVESAYSVGRLGEMIMEIGVLFGHAPTSPDERRTAILAVMGAADGAAVGVSGLAARAGSRGGARLIQRLPIAPTGVAVNRGRRTIARLANGRGPWSVAALVPYGIGAGVGAAGNALLVRAVGRAAKQYYRSASEEGLPDNRDPEGPMVDLDADIVDAEIVDTGAVDPPVAG